MKLFHKLGLLSFGLCALTTTVVFSATSCAKSNPYEDYATGATITIKSKADANNCDLIAKQNIATQSATVITKGEWEKNSFPVKVITHDDSGNPDFAYASTQIYWELVHYMCSVYQKDTSSIEITGATISDGSCIFINNNQASTEEVFLNDNVSIKCVNFLNNETFNNKLGFGYVAPKEGKTHFTLGFGDASIESYGLWTWTYKA